jgi:1,4-alpha-glucan branching enzyme
LLYGYMMCHPGKKLLFMGGEYGQFNEWKDESELDWMLLDYDMHRSMKHYVKALNSFYKNTRSLWRVDHHGEGFQWIDANDHAQSVITFIRKGKRRGDYCIIVCNFSSAAYFDYRIGIPSLGIYEEIFNSDAVEYGGSGQLNDHEMKAEKIGYHNQPYSATITVPPLGVTILKKKSERKGS